MPLLVFFAFTSRFEFPFWFLLLLNWRTFSISCVVSLAAMTLSFYFWKSLSFALLIWKIVWLDIGVLDYTFFASPFFPLSALWTYHFFPAYIVLIKCYLLILSEDTCMWRPFSFWCFQDFLFAFTFNMITMCLGVVLWIYSV